MRRNRTCFCCVAYLQLFGALYTALQTIINIIFFFSHNKDCCGKKIVGNQRFSKNAKNRNSTKRKQIRWNLLIFFKKTPRKKKNPARAGKKSAKKRVGRAPFFSKQFGVHADFFFENRGLFPRKSFRKNVFSAGIAGAQNRVFLQNPFNYFWDF